MRRPARAHRVVSGTRRRERGAVFVEFALVVPLMMLLAMGIVEFGIGWKWANDVNAAARDAARSGSSATAYLTADRAVLLSIGSSLDDDQLDGLEKVIVFKASSSDGDVPSDCKALSNTDGSVSSPGTPAGKSGCNVYGPGQIEYVLANPSDSVPWVNAAKTGCDSGDLDHHWCPAGRDHSQASDSFDYLGVYVEVEKPSTTNFGFGSQTIERTAVFKLEPKFGGD